jgi:carboxypeptidase D
MNSNLQYEVNPHGWHTMASMLFIDSPTGVGYSSRSSSAPTISSVTQVAEHYWEFCQEFLELFPVTKSYEWHLNGESYGGMYIPHIADLFLTRNQKLQPNEQAVPLKSISIGSGVYFSPHEYPASGPAYLDAVGLLRDPLEKERLFQLTKPCTHELTGAQKVGDPALHRACGELDRLLSDPDYLMKISNKAYCGATSWDIRYRTCESIDPYEGHVGNTTMYLSQLDVREALHVRSRVRFWMHANIDLMSQLLYNGDRPSYPLLSKLLNQRMRITLYHGDRDMLCNYVGIENALHAMQWRGRQGFQSGPVERAEQDRYYGTIKWAARGLTYYRMVNAGHYVSFDQAPYMKLIMGRILTS